MTAIVTGQGSGFLCTHSSLIMFLENTGILHPIPAMTCRSSYTNYPHSALLSHLQPTRNLEMPHVSPGWVYDLTLHSSEFLFFIAPPINIILFFLCSIQILFYRDYSLLTLEGHFD